METQSSWSTEMQRARVRLSSWSLEAISIFLTTIQQMAMAHLLGARLVSHTLTYLLYLLLRPTASWRVSPIPPRGRPQPTGPSPAQGREQSSESMNPTHRAGLCPWEPPWAVQERPDPGRGLC